jgi:hypothetical protein
LLNGLENRPFFVCDTKDVSVDPAPRRRRRGGPLRRWARHTPNNRIALNLIAAGAILGVVAIVLGMTFL